MKRKILNIEQLSDFLLGNNDPQMYTELLETDEVKALMYHQWKNPQEVKSVKKPDLDIIFDRIKAKTQPDQAKKSANTEYLLHEINSLKTQNRSIKKRFTTIIGIAAAILLLVSIFSITIVTRNQVFTKTYTENIVPKGQKSQVVLPDGTRVMLNGGSILKYDNFFGKRYRNLELVGEGFFEVSKNDKLPFIINAGDVEVKVVGTKFNVMAYAEDNIIETIVTEGKVSVKEKSGSSVLLTANQRATYHKESQLLLMNDINPEPYLSWKEDMLIFDNAGFEDVITKLERWYDVSIEVKGTDSIPDRYTMKIKSESLREVLELISLTTDINYAIRADQVIIKYE